MTYAVVSDLHCHKWSTFASVDRDGVNSRLRIILNELRRAATALKDAGGSTLVIAGDIFHVRGSLDPEVLNPVQDTIRAILDDGIEILALPGNHDLASKDTSRLSSSVQTLAETFSADAAITVFNEPQLVFGSEPKAIVPWRASTSALLTDIEDLAALAGSDVGDFDLFIHAGIDGVLSAMPDHGLTAERLAKPGFKRVFAGHYHHHKDFGNGVYSIGATTHQTWSDVDSIAGFLIVDDAKVELHRTYAPEFVDISGFDEDDMANVADGNYARFRGGAMKPEDVRELRQFLFDSGARGVSIQVVKETVTARPSGTGKSMSLDQSIDAFVDGAKDIPAHVDRKIVKNMCLDVLRETRAVIEEA